MTQRELYLHTVKHALTGLLHRDVYVVDGEHGAFSGRTASRSERQIGRDWPAVGETMIGVERLNNIQACLETAIADNVPGDFIEAGVWRGGASIFARAVLAAHLSSRSVYVADSFKGFPPARPEDGDDPHHARNFLYLQVPQHEVADAFERYGLLDAQVNFVPGYFADSLPALATRRPSPQWAVIRADGDSYSSTMDILQSLYPALSPGGFVIIDDYDNVRPDDSPSKRAVGDFRRQHGITAPIQTIDWVGVFWRRA